MKSTRYHDLSGYLTPGVTHSGIEVSTKQYSQQNVTRRLLPDEWLRLLRFALLNSASV